MLFKDFNSHGTDGIHLREDMTFMTNADTGMLATKNLIPNANGIQSMTVFLKMKIGLK